MKKGQRKERERKEEMKRNKRDKKRSVFGKGRINPKDEILQRFEIAKNEKNTKKRVSS